MDDTLTKESESSPTISHAFDEFQLIDLPFDQAIVVGKSKSCDGCRFVMLNT